jgi:hypothetical protein
VLRKGRGDGVGLKKSSRLSMSSLHNSGFERMSQPDLGWDRFTDALPYCFEIPHASETCLRASETLR